MTCYPRTANESLQNEPRASLLIHILAESRIQLRIYNAAILQQAQSIAHPDKDQTRRRGER